MIPCAHRLETSSGWLYCQLEAGHGQPHECPIGNSTGTENRSPADPVRSYPAAAVVVWHETKERVA